MTAAFVVMTPIMWLAKPKYLLHDPLQKKTLPTLGIVFFFFFGV